MNDRIDDDRDSEQAGISALADGQFDEEALDRALELLKRDPAALEAWQAYHLIGDVLRSPELAGGTAPHVFLAGVKERLAQEAPFSTAGPAPLEPARKREDSANDSVFRWKRVAALVSLVLATTAGWFAAGTWRDAPAPQLATDDAGRMWRDARLDELLHAHRQLGAATALQAPAGFLHPAAFERPASGR